MASINDEIKRMEKEKKKLIKEMEKLEDVKSRNEIPEEDYEIEKNKIERKIVEVMDRLVQFRFLKG
ncbi:MAG: hypothetical protein HWN67_01655 [Candidatus Helarchaeota archaeon]|nr:hypothetical protein [Candidatus Helarchaeota archaeon]